MAKTIKKAQAGKRVSGPSKPAKQINAAAKREAAKSGPKKPVSDSTCTKQVFPPLSAADSAYHKAKMEKALRDIKENENLRRNPYGAGKYKKGGKVTKKAMYGTMAKYGAKKVVKKKK